MQRHKQLTGRYDGPDYVTSTDVATDRARPRHAHVGVRAGARGARPRHDPSRRTACSSAASSSTPRDGAVVQDRRTRPPRRCWPRSRRPARPTSTPPSPPPGGPRPLGRGCPARERAKYLYRIARIIQERSRELAVLESIDNGKPIKETRDVDLPLVAAHFFYYAGWADKLDYAGFGPDPQPGRRVPARSSRGTSRCSCWRGRSPRRWPAATPSCSSRPRPRRSPRWPSPRSASRPSCPPGVVNIVTGAGETGRAARASIPASTRSRSPARPRSASRSSARWPAPGKRLTLELGGKAANIVFDDAPIDQAVEGIVNGIFFNQGHVCCAGSRLLVQESVHDAVIDRAEAPARHAAPRRPARQEHRHRRDQLRARSWPASPSWSPPARRRAPTAWQPPCDLPASGLLVRPDGLHRRRPEPPHRPRGDLRPGAVGAHVPHARRGGRQGQQHAVRAVGRRLDREGLAHPVDGAAAARRRGVGQHVQPVRPGVARSAATRSRASAARAAATGSAPTCEAESLMAERLDVRKTYKLYVGGAFPRSESGRTYEVTDAEGPVPRQRGAGRRARTRATPSWPPAARSAAWSGATAVQPRAGAVPRRRDARGRAGPVRRRGGGRRGARRRAAADGRRRRRHRPVGLVRGLVRQDRPDRRRRRTPSPARTSTSRCPSRPAWSRCVAPQASSLLGLVSVVAPVIVSGNTVRGRGRRSDRPLPAVTLGEVLATSDVPGGVVNMLTGHGGRAGAGARRPPRRQRPRPDRRAGDADAGPRARGRGGREREAGAAGAGRRAGLDRGAGPSPHPGLLRDEDGVAPDRCASGAKGRAGLSAPRYFDMTATPRASDLWARRARSAASGYRQRRRGCRPSRLDDGRDAQAGGAEQRVLRLDALVDDAQPLVERRERALHRVDREPLEVVPAVAERVAELAQLVASSTCRSSAGCRC